MLRDFRPAYVSPSDLGATGFSIAKGSTMKCPQCGDTEHLYRDAEIRWMPTLGAWEVTYENDWVDCTNCHAEFDYEEASNG